MLLYWKEDEEDVDDDEPYYQESDEEDSQTKPTLGNCSSDFIAVENKLRFFQYLIVYTILQHNIVCQVTKVAVVTSTENRQRMRT